jgi:hypothetical protein
MADNKETYKKVAVPNTILPPMKKPDGAEDPNKMDSHDKMKTRKPEQDSEHLNKTPEEMQKRQAEFAKRKAQRDMERKKRGLKIGPNIYGGGINPAAATTTSTGTKVSNV